MPSSNGLRYMLSEGRYRPTTRRQGEHKKLLRPLRRWLKGLHLLCRIAVIALILTASMLTALMDSAYAAGRGPVYAATHHAGHPRKALKRRKRVRSAVMPPAPTDFGPHFDFPPASLNDGPTQAPYPGW
jgi:hypothetical protein